MHCCVTHNNLYAAESEHLLTGTHYAMGYFQMFDGKNKQSINLKVTVFIMTASLNNAR